MYPYKFNFKEFIKNLFIEKGSFDWAWQQLRAGKIVRRDCAKPMPLRYLRYQIHHGDGVIRGTTSEPGYDPEWSVDGFDFNDIEANDWVIADYYGFDGGGIRTDKSWPPVKPDAFPADKIIKQSQTQVS